MARSICFFAIAMLALMLFVAYETEAGTCKAECPTWEGICINKGPCVKCCKAQPEKFTDGHCSKILRRCLCTKPCATEEATATLANEVKTMAEALVEEDMME